MSQFDEDLKELEEYIPNATLMAMARMVRWLVKQAQQNRERDDGYCPPVDDTEYPKADQ